MSANFKVIFFPGLNGLRAIASLAVVISHITHNLNQFHLNPFIFGAFNDGTPKGLDLAGHGVSIFFCLSGFLITYLLQLEQEKRTVNVKEFYLRRILRTWPLHYLYLFVVVLVLLFWKINIDFKEVILYVFFLGNLSFVLQMSIPLLVHYWSIGVEEQFYLIWPWMNRKKDSNKIVLYTVAAILIIITVKLLLHFIYPHSIYEAIIHVTRMHCMMIGAVGAILYKQKHKLFMKIVDYKITQWGCWGIIFFVMINKFHIASVLDNEILSVVALFIIIGQANVKNRVVNLDIGVFDFLGKISYGIYIIHPLVIFFFVKYLSDIELNDSAKYLFLYSSIISITIFLAYFSYEYYEKIFIRMKARYSAVVSSGTRNV